MFPFAVLISLAMSCTTPQPVSSWVCVNGGWVPPEMVQQQQPAPPTILAPGETIINPPLNELVTPWPPVTYTGPNAWIVRAAQNGEALPNGDVWFTPPLILKNVAALRGSGRTVLRPTTTAAGTLIIIQSSLPGWDEIGYTLRTVVEDISLICGSNTQVGIAIQGAGMTFKHLTVAQCGNGMRFDWAVNISIKDSQFMKNKVGLHFTGSPTNSITTVRVEDSVVSMCNTGIAVWRGLHLIFQDIILEANGIGLQVIPRWNRVEVLLRDGYFESNGTHYYDPNRIIVFEGNSGVY